MKRKKDFKGFDVRLSSISKALEKHERIIKLAVTVIAIVAALFFFGEKGENDTILKTEAKESPLGAEVMAEEELEEKKESTAPLNIKEQKFITVDISGEVLNPGIYTLKEDARLNDLIEAAGGLTEKADIDRINRASYLSDAAKIYIPSMEEDSSFMENMGGDASYSSGLNMGSQNKSEKININTSSAAELETIPGIGPVTAEKIVIYRETMGKFKSIEDIMNVSGIGEKTFEKIREYISV